MAELIGTVSQALLGALTLIIITAIATGRQYVIDWLKARTTSANRETLHRVASEAYAYVEKTLKGSGAVKAQLAIQYVIARINLDKFGITTEDVTAAIQKAWAELDPNNKPVVQSPNNNTTTIGTVNKRTTIQQVTDPAPQPILATELTEHTPGSFNDNEQTGP